MLTYDGPGDLGAAGSPRASAKLHTTMFRVLVPIGALTALYGHTVAWGGTEQVPHPSRLYLADTRKFRPVPLTTSARGGQFNFIQLSAHWIVWIEYGEANFSWLLQAQNRQTGRRYLVDSSAREGYPPHPMAYPTLSLSGDTLAWTHVACGGKRCLTHWTSSVSVRTLPTGADQIVSSVQYPCYQTLPWLSQAVVVWDDEGTCNGHDGTDVMMFERRANRVRAVTTNHVSSEATTNGRYVAWKQVKPSQQHQSRLTNGDIVLLDLRSGTRRIVSNRRMCHDPQTGVGSCATSPHLTDNILAWEALNGDTIEALDLATGRHYAVAQATYSKLYGTGPGLLGFGWSKRLVWQPYKLNHRTSKEINYIATGDVP